MNVLIIAGLFPPSNKVSTHRIESWYKYLPEKGITPYVITFNQESHGERIYTVTVDAAVNVKSKLSIIKNIYREYLGYKKSKFYPYVSKAIEICDRCNIDLIIVSGAPFELFKIARVVSDITKIPWVADYKDGWSTNINYERKKRILSNAYRLIEKSIVNTSSFITTASPTYKSALQKLFPNKPVEVVYNGYMEEDFEGLSRKQVKDKIVFSYLGNLYDYQKLEPFLRGLEMFISKSDNKYSFEINFYGLNASEIPRLNEFRSKYAKEVKIHPYLKRKEVLQLAYNSHILLLFLNKDVVALPAKTFDYIALNLPILVVENDKSVVESLLKDNPNSYFADNESEVSKAIEEIVKKINHPALSLDNKMWSRRYQTYRLADYLWRYYTNEIYENPKDNNCA